MEISDLKIGNPYSWDQVKKCGGEETFLGKRGNKIVVATLNGKKNPEAPEVMVVGDKAKNRKRAEEFCQQKGSLPIFIKERRNKWTYYGKYEFERFTDEPDELKKHQNEANRNLTRIIFLRPAEGQKPNVKVNADDDGRMAANRVAALIVCYFLSRFDAEARKSLGYATWNDAYASIGKALKVNPTSIKNMRDEFDPIHQNNRKGWHQRPLRPSRVDVVEKFGELAQTEMLEIVKGILWEKAFEGEGELGDIVVQIGSGEEKKPRNSAYVNRSGTGRAAEEAFLKNRKEINVIFCGNLSDKRDEGCGYDFEIDDGAEKTFVEIKGLDGETGGVCFSSKEWDQAKTLGGLYWLVLVRNASSSSPSFQCVQAPVEKLVARKSFVQRVQILWNVAEKELRKHHL